MHLSLAKSGGGTNASLYFQDDLHQPSRLGVLFLLLRPSVLREIGLHRSGESRSKHNQLLPRHLRGRRRIVTLRLRAAGSVGEYHTVSDSLLR